MGIEIPIILVSIAGFFFWALVGYAMGHRDGVREESLRQRRLRKSVSI